MDEGSSRGQGLDLNDARCQGLEDQNIRGQGLQIDDARCQGLIPDDARGQGLDYDSRGQGLDFGARGQGPHVNDTRGQGPHVNDTRGQRVTDGTARGQELRFLIKHKPGTSREYPSRGRDSYRKIVHRRKSRLTSNGSEEELSGNTSKRRRGRSTERYRERQSRRKRRRSSSTESSGGSDNAHSKSKSIKSSDNDINIILDKVLSVIKTVRSSDKPKLSYNNNVIPDFDPMTKEQSILTWINKVEECAEIYGWDEKETIHYSLPKLCGIAKSWYQGLPTLLYSWLEWKNKLIESFPCCENHAELLTEMLSKRVRYGDSLERYYYAKINLLNRCEINGRQAVDCLLHGVDDRTVKIGAQAAQFSEPEQVLKYFRSVKVGHPSRESNDNFRTNRTDRNTFPNDKPILTTPENNLNIRCFNCNQIGHPSFRCNKPLAKCSNCDRVGHQTTNCYRIKSKDIQSSNSTSDKNDKQVSERCNQ